MIDSSSISDQNPGKSKSNLILRIISGSVLGAMSFFCLIKGDFYFSIFVLIVSAISYLEWFSIATSKLYEKDQDDHKAHINLWGVLGLVAILPSAISILYMRYIIGLNSVLYMMSVIILTDVGAFFFGKAIGGPKLAPSISPGKTISGSVCGIGVSVCGAIVLQISGYVQVDYKDLVLMTVVLSIASQIGDLMESKFKRHFGVKDSGKLIPGHGGFLDRTDSFLITAPVFMIFVLLGFFK